ncbi:MULTISPECIES: hypothetical protein [Lysinibacillus]|nr:MULTISPECIES: hypothetical protein [Lysinibacillus]
MSVRVNYGVGSFGRIISALLGCCVRRNVVITADVVLAEVQGIQHIRQ